MAEQDTRLAISIIDDAFDDMVEDFHEQVRIGESALASARMNLEIAQRQHAAWRKDRTFDQTIGFRAVANAQIADLTPTDLPAGIHLRALSAYLAEHDETWRPQEIRRRIPP